MKKFKNFSWIALIAIVLLPLAIVKADPDKLVVASTVESLNNQLYFELKDVLTEHISLAFQDRELKGTAFVLMKVTKDGKIEIANISSDNETLKRLVIGQIKSRNMWTDKRYANSIFRYKVEMI